MATLIKIDKNGTRYFEEVCSCEKCGGTGTFECGIYVNSHVVNADDEAVANSCAMEYDSVVAILLHIENLGLVAIHRDGSSIGARELISGDGGEGRFNGGVAEDCVDARIAVDRYAVGRHRDERHIVGRKIRNRQVH